MVDAADASAPSVLLTLRGACVQRVDLPEPDLLALGLHQDRVSRTLLLSVSDAAPGLGVVEERPRGAPAGSIAQLLRKHLVGATIVRVACVARGMVYVVLRRADDVATLRVYIARRNSGVVIADASGRVLGGIPRGACSIADTHAGPADVDEWPRDEAELRVAGKALLARRAGEGAEGRASELRRVLGRGRARVVRRVRAIEGDLAATQIAPSLRRDASLVLSAMRTIPRGATEIVIDDPETDLPRRITLDPALAPKEQAERLFVRARKLDRGAKIATERLAAARAEVERYDQALAALDRGDASVGEALATTRATTTRARPDARPRLPFRTFTLEDGTVVRVGRSARDNDALTWKHASPDDWFFHARARTGSHVILRGTPGRDVTDEARLAAAILAAHFSSARGDTAVDVTCAARRTLRRGPRAGAVLTHEATTVRAPLATYPLAALLARESRV